LKFAEQRKTTNYHSIPFKKARNLMGPPPPLKLKKIILKWKKLGTIMKRSIGISQRNGMELPLLS